MSYLYPEWDSKYPVENCGIWREQCD